MAGPLSETEKTRIRERLKARGIIQALKPNAQRVAHYIPTRELLLKYGPWAGQPGTLMVATGFIQTIAQFWNSMSAIDGVQVDFLQRQYLDRNDQNLRLALRPDGVRRDQSGAWGK